jgi:hypothetical protein
MIADDDFGMDLPRSLQDRAAFHVLSDAPLDALLGDGCRPFVDRRAFRRIACAGLVGLGLLVKARSAAATPSAKLVFARGADTEVCPDEQGFRAAVAARVGYDPFFPYAKRTVVTRIDAVAGGRFRARMETLDEKGTLVGEKSFVSVPRDCDELVRTLALAVSLAIDIADAPASEEPEAVPSAPPQKATSPLPVDVAPAPERPIQQPPPAAPTRASVELSATARGTVGLAFSPNLGLGVGAALRRRPWSVGIEGRYDPPAESDVGVARLSVGLVAGSLVPCLDWKWFFGCAVGTVGRLSAESSGIRNPASDAALFVAFGGRVGAEIEATSKLGFRAALDVAAAPIAHAARVGLRDVYETSAVLGSFGASAVVRF